VNSFRSTRADPAEFTTFVETPPAAGDGTL
jgi:hypothetical protein